MYVPSERKADQAEILQNIRLLLSTFCHIPGFLLQKRIFLPNMHVEMNGLLLEKRRFQKEELHPHDHVVFRRPENRPVSKALSAVQEVRYVIHTITFLAVFGDEKVYFSVEKVCFSFENCVFQPNFQNFANFWSVLEWKL